jgi:hypothetical protein
MAEMEDPRGKYEGDPCPNCGYPRDLGKLCPQCHAQMFRGRSARLDSSTREMPVIPRPTGHVCFTSDRGPGHCGDCDTAFICPACKHNGMQARRCQPPNFILRCPGCGHEKSIHWIEYDLRCPRCGREDAFGTHTRSFERIIQCPNCGVSPRGEAA